MYLRRKIFITLLILYDILTLAQAQEYLKELQPKEIKLSINDELPPVEIPKPIQLHRQAKSQPDTEFTDGWEDEGQRAKSERPTLMDIALEASVREGILAMRRLYSVLEPEMVKNGHVLRDDHPAALLSRFSAPVVETTRREMAAYATLTAAKAFRKNYELSNELARQAHTQKISLRRTALESLCPPRDPPTCMPASERYRTHDGTCNNKRRLRWGAAQMPFNRFLPPEYGDGVDSTRNSVDGGPLSSSRFVSLLVHGAREGEASLTLMLAQWGQLLDHDLTSTAQPRSINGSVPSCCGNKDFHPSCFPIKVPLDDPWLSPLKVRCLEFLRSAPAQRRDCILSWREQTNQVTSYIDASPIYSSSVKSSDNARVFRNGLLIFGRGNPADDVCQRGAIATNCIRSGDGRSGEQPGLLAMHHVWVHEHNHIAMMLSEMNLHWSDEKIYQEARRIIGAMFQHITYREFIPIVLGREVAKLFDLELLSSGYYEGYNPKANPTVANAFSAAAFRFGHSLVQNSYMRCDRFHNMMNNNVSLHEEFQRGDIGSVGSLHRLIRGMASQRALKRDEFITPELTNHLFQTPGFPFGLDLAAINIQRGRDHGVPPYSHWRVPCGLTPITTWDEFANVVGPESARRISHAYHSVHDIDLFVGGIAERPVVGGLVGPTFACIIAQQFSNARKGDRFWYENAGFESSLTPAQLHAIRRVSLASVLCRAVGGGTFQPHIFLPPEFPNNERMPCGVGSLAEFDIGPWLEQDPFAALPARPPQVQQPPTTQPTFKPQPLPDRIFDIMELETKSPVSADTSNSDNKVGFSNRVPAIANIKNTPTLVNKPAEVSHVEFVPNTSNGLPPVKDGAKINDKLDLKKKGTQVHVTKQKPVPGVNNKLDKNNRKGGNRHGLIQTTTRRTIVINNIPIELRTNDKTKDKLQTKTNLESRIADTELITESTKAKEKKNNDTKITDIKLILQTENTTNTESQQENLDDKVRTKEHEEEQHLGTENTVDSTVKLEARTEDIEIIEHVEQAQDKTKQQLDDSEISKLTEKTEQSKINSTRNTNNKLNNLANTTDSLDKNNEDITLTFSKLNSDNATLNTNTDSKHDNNTINVTDHNNDLTLKPTTSSVHTTDSDIDPMIHSTSLVDHKRVQRTLPLPITATEQLKDKPKFSTLNNATSSTTTNKTLTTKRPNRTTLRNFELRQYQNRPSYTKPPQKVIVDSNDEQYQIEINIRQTNKSPKPIQSTPYEEEDYTNGHKTNQYDRYTANYQTTPSYAYYQPVPTKYSSLTQTHITKPPTIIFINEYEQQQQQTSTRKPGFLHSVLGWNSASNKPLPSSNGVNERPGYEGIIQSPHSTAVVAPAYQNLRPSSQVAAPGTISSFSQAQLGGVGLAQATAVSNGNFGSIAGFASANGADSTFSFNIRKKQDKTQNNRPGSFGSGVGGSYGLQQTQQQNPWYTQKPEYINLPAHIYPPAYELPNRENGISPFSTSNSQTYYIRNKHGPQRKEVLTLDHSQEFTDYDYTSRTLETLHNITDSEEKDDTDIDYEYSEDYRTSPLLRKFNQDGYLRPEHMIDTVHKSIDDKTDTTSTNLTITEPEHETLDDNYVLPVLNSTNDLPLDLPKPINTNFSTQFPDSVGKHLTNDIFADDLVDEEGTITQDKLNVLQEFKHKRNKNKINRRNQEMIAFAPINVLTKPERPDNWVIFESPKEEPILPRIPELNMDFVPSAEVPKPIKENAWLDLTNLKRKLALQFLESTESSVKEQVKPQVELVDTTTEGNIRERNLKTEESTNLSTETVNDSTDDATETVKLNTNINEETGNWNDQITMTDDLNEETTSITTIDKTDV